jgi:DNA-binding transcriptional regulator LsrR (DeoR family)
MTAQLRRLPATPVVQLTGALSLPDSEDSATELVRNVAQLSGGPAYVFYAPLIVPDAATASVLRSQPEVARAFEQIGSVTKAVVGVGRWAVGQSTVFDATDAKERAKLARQGVVADISGVLLYADGSPVDTPLTERMIGITAKQMRLIPEVIAIVYGPEKVPAVLAALRSGLVKGLVTHAPVARAMLDAV